MLRRTSGSYRILQHEAANSALGIQDADGTEWLNAALEAGWPGFQIGERIPLEEIARAHELVEHPVRPGTGCRRALMKLYPIGRTLKFPDMIKTDR